MKKISIVQPNFQQGPKEFNAYYLPYSAGVLWSYIQKFEHLKNTYELNHIIWRRDPLDQILSKIANDDIVAFSTYVWNKNYNYELARKIKEINPSCVIVFGGPEVPIEDRKIFEKLPFIDYVVKSEGEKIFKSLLESLKDNTPDEEIKGLLINRNGSAIDTGQGERISELDDIPSPYLTGVFDKIMAETTGVEWNATLETNRGCPYACTFCDWGSLTYNKVKKFNLERVFDEMEWIGRNGCGFVTITDANFGIFVERDNLIADKLLEVQDKYGCPNSFSMAWAKDQKPEVFDIVFKLIKSPKYNQGLTVSVQSMELDVLENIKRRNLDQHKLDTIFALCDKNNVPIYTELILGLPGETKASWKDGIFKIIRAGNHTGINLLQAQLLENAEMNLLQRRMYKMTSVPVYDYMSGSYAFDEIEESVEVVTSTASMSKDEMMDSLIFNWFIQTFHINGMTTYLARFLNKYVGLDYAEFYDKFYEFLQKDPWFLQEQKELELYYTNWMTDGRINHPRIGNVEVHGWNLVHRTTLNIIKFKKYQHVFNLIESFAKELNLVDNDLLNELLEFQKNYVIDYDDIHLFPQIKQFNYDFLGYIQNEGELNKPLEYKFEFQDRTDITLDGFLENIYFGRKRNFGKALVTKLQNNILDNPVMNLLLLD